ncbi:MAG: Nif11-like leader peptide family natural product precursor [Arcobacteraceae bacterium]
MSKNSIEKFLADVNEKKEFQDELKVIGLDFEKVTLFANSKGYDFTISDLQSYADTKKGELSDDELGNVAGGKFINNAIYF